MVALSVGMAASCALTEWAQEHLSARLSERLTVITGAYLFATVTSFVVYVAVLQIVRRTRLQGIAAVLLYAAPVACSTALWTRPPTLSIDTYSYVLQGQRLRTGHNPYAEPDRTAADTAFGRELMHAGWLPVHDRSPYGPIWTAVEEFVAHRGADLRTEVIYFKTIALSAMFACAVLIWAIARELAPGAEQAATVLFLWNPLVLFEFAGDGHNDVLAMACALLSVLLLLRRRVSSATLTLAIACLVKINQAVLAWPLGVYAARAGRTRCDVWWRVAGGVAAALMVAFVVFRPIWVGAATFDGLRLVSSPRIIASTPGVLFLVLRRWIPDRVVIPVLRLVCVGAVAGYASTSTAAVRDGMSACRVSARIALVTMLLAPTYWPWYAALPVALMALVPTDSAMVMILSLSVGARLVAPIDVLRLSGVVGWNSQTWLMTVFGLWIPLLIAGVIVTTRFDRVIGRSLIVRPW